MKLLIIRHGDPDYEKDSLTEKGWREARYLSERISKLNVRDFYVSPLGRAKDTASLTLQKMGRTATQCEWLREFSPTILRPDAGHPTICWDWLPQDWTAYDPFFQYDDWSSHELLEAGNVKDEYTWVTENFDRLLAQYGYIREGRFYRVEQSNNDTIVFFCHMGLECVLLSHLFNLSPMVLWHMTCAAPTSVTTLTTEERRKGIALFRMSAFGDISHLNAHDEPPAFAARFCESYENTDQRHD